MNNFRITKHRKADGWPLVQLGGSEARPLIHMDSDMVWQGKLYAPHSNYPALPMASSAEVWDMQGTEHIAATVLMSGWIPFTWLDR